MKCQTPLCSYRITFVAMIGLSEIHVEEVGSTNEFLQQLCVASRLAEGCVVYTDFQIAGRGQMGNVWESESGKNLLISILLLPDWLPVSAQFWLNIAVSLAVHDTISSLIPSVEGIAVKWPNDLYIGNQKCGGILIQNSIQSGRITYTIVGIGLNINQMAFSTAPNATSLAQVSGSVIDLSFVRNTLYACLTKRYEQLRSGEKDLLRNQYYGALLGMGIERLFEDTKSDDTFMGTIIGVAESGHLEILTRTGVRLVQIKEVSFVL